MNSAAAAPHACSCICKTGLLDIEVLIDFLLQLITHLLGISQQHLRVVFVEDWVVGTSISCTHGALHDNHLLALPDLQPTAKRLQQQVTCC